MPEIVGVRISELDESDGFDVKLEVYQQDTAAMTSFSN